MGSLNRLKEKMVQKRLEREEKEKREAKEKERLRRTQGKDLTMAKFEYVCLPHLHNISVN